MIKRNILLAAFGLLILLSVISILPVVNGYDYTFIDEEDDVYQYCQSTEEVVTGDYHDEIDIVKLNITGKYVSFTVAGNLSDWNISHSAELVFAQGFMPTGPLGIAWTIPFYRLEFDSSFVSLDKVYVGEGQCIHEEWNGTNWENSTTATPANILSDVTQHSIIAYIPYLVEEIPSNLKCLLYTRFFSFECEYRDFSPALPTTGGGGEIAGYNVFLLICVMIGISLLLMRKRNKLR